MSANEAEDTLTRYARHIVLRHVGGPGQKKLSAARVLVVGAGGLGAPLIQYLAAAGVGTIGIADDDHVSLSNLQRQVIHTSADIGRSKVESAAEAAMALNPHVTTPMHPLRIDAENALDFVDLYDVIADATDNFDARYALAEACETGRKPLVSAAVNEFHGSLTVLKPYAKGADGAPLPRYRDLYPEKPAAGVVPTCAEAGVLGALCGVIGSLQAIEVMKQIVGFGDPLIGKLLIVDALDMRFDTITYARTA